MNIYEKLLTIQEAIEKIAHDASGHGYKYTSGSSLLSKIRPLMCAQKLILKQEVTGIQNTRIDYTLKDGRIKSEILTTVEIKFTWVDCETMETDVNVFAANGMNDWDKGLGSALTYAERYFLLKYFHIATDEDDVDAQPEKPGYRATPQPENNLPWINDEQVLKAIDYIKGGGTMADIKAKYKISKVNFAKITEGVKNDTQP